MEIVAHGIDDLDQAAGQLLQSFGTPRIFAFFGEMGAGKTTFIKAICRKLGVDEKEMSSPTFSLVNEYHTASGEIIYHFDFYRVEKESEAFDMGYEEYFYGGNLCLIEWPEKIPNLLPENYVKVQIAVRGGSRLISIT